MDRLESIGDRLSKITIYDIKQAYTQVSLPRRFCSAVTARPLRRVLGEEYGTKCLGDGSQSP
jgi:hypothetical protein